MRSGRSTGSKPAALVSPSGINHKIPSKHSPRFRGAGSEHKGAHMHNTHRRLLREAGWNALRGYIPFEGVRLLLFRHALLQHCSRDYVYMCLCAVYSITTFIRDIRTLLQIRQVAHLMEHDMQPARMKPHAKEHTNNPVQRPNLRGHAITKREGRVLDLP